MAQSTTLQKAQALFAEREAVYAERSRILSIIAAGKRFGATRAEVDEAIQGDVTAADFARHHEIEALAGSIASSLP